MKLRADRMTVMLPREAMTWCFVRALGYDWLGDRAMANALVHDGVDKIPDALRQIELEQRRCIRCGGPLDLAERGPDHIDCLFGGVPVAKAQRP